MGHNKVNLEYTNAKQTKMGHHKVNLWFSNLPEINKIIKIICYNYWKKKLTAYK